MRKKYIVYDEDGIRFVDREEAIRSVNEGKEVSRVKRIGNFFGFDIYFDLDKKKTIVFYDEKCEYFINNFIFN